MEPGEDRLVDAIRRVLSGATGGAVVGIGDDAAVVTPPDGETVLTTDLLVEDVHFERASISAHDLGAKAIAVNVSDIAAMAARPRYALVALGLGPDVTEGWLIELYGGMREACERDGLAIVGGDLNRAARTVIAVTVVGEVEPDCALTRAGARVGDRILVTGSLGGAAGGLALTRAETPIAERALEAGWGRDLLEAFLRPRARVAEARELAERGATAMMDLSDGLARDLPRLCERSGVGARLRIDDVPVAAALREGASTLGVDAPSLAIGGGEDYELLVTMPADAVAGARAALADRYGLALTEVGAIVAGAGVVGERDGAEVPLPSAGWDHFAS